METNETIVYELASTSPPLQVTAMLRETYVHGNPRGINFIQESTVTPHFYSLHPLRRVKNSMGRVSFAFRFRSWPGLAVCTLFSIKFRFRFSFSPFQLQHGNPLPACAFPSLFGAILRHGRS